MSTPARKRLMRDFKRLQQDPPAGISGAPHDNNIMLWNAVIFGWVIPRSSFVPRPLAPEFVSPVPVLGFGALDLGGRETVPHLFLFYPCLRC